MTVKVKCYLMKPGLDPLGWFLCTQQRSAISHVAFEINGMYVGTGAHNSWLKGPVFGELPAAEYDKDRDYYECELVDPLTEEEELQLLAALKPLYGQRYGYEKVTRLDVAGNLKPDFICELGDLQLEIKNPFCSESVVYGLWKVNRPVCRQLCRREPEVCSPNDVYLDALQKNVLKIVNVVRRQGRKAA
jgi:hypothetical protein